MMWLIALGSFLLPFLLALCFCRFCIVGRGEKPNRENAELFWILVMICLPLLMIVVGHFTGFWDWMDK